MDGEDGDEAFPDDACGPCMRPGCRLCIKSQNCEVTIIEPRGDGLCSDPSCDLCEASRFATLRSKGCKCEVV